MRRAAFVFAVVLCANSRADDWPQWLGPHRDGVWRETGLIEKFPASGAKIKLRRDIGAGYAGPAVVGDRVYVMARALKEGVKNPLNVFSRAAIPGTEKIVCLDDATGQIVWTHEYDCAYTIAYPAGPRTTPVIADGKVYALGAMGDLWCLDAAKGSVIWHRNFLKDFDLPQAPLWGFASHPLLDGDRVITLVGGDGSVVVAFHKDTGKEIWRQLSAKEPGYGPPAIYTVGKTRQLIVWNPETVDGLVPETGAKLWSYPFESKAALTVPMPRLDGDKLFLTSFYNSAILLKLGTDKPGAEVVWRGNGKSEQPTKTEILHSIMPTPIIKNGYIYGICSYGELRCINEATGSRVWESLEATRRKVDGKMQPSSLKPGDRERWGNALLVEQGDRTVIFNEKGDLILARLSPSGYEEIDRAHVIAPDNYMAGRATVWSHPAYAHKCAYVRNDKEIVCVSMAAE